jgi:hypothetical protein
MQFFGSLTDSWDSLWASRVENKCKFFCWLILQNKLWTKDRITKFGGQTNQICSLCHIHKESALHMVALCPYSKLVWRRISGWLGTTLQAPSALHYRKFKSWWMSMMQTKPHDWEDRARKVIYTIWTIWKERCHRDFDNKALTDFQLQERIKADVSQWVLAWSSRGEQSSPPDALVAS